MITITDKATRQEYRGRTVDSVVRRVYGRTAHIRTVQRYEDRMLGTVTLVSPRIDDAESVAGEVWFDPDAARDRDDEYLDDAIPDVLAEVMRADAQRDSAQQLLDDADAQWREAIRAAVRAGHTLDDVAQYAGVTRQRVMQVRDGTR